VTAELDASRAHEPTKLRALAECLRAVERCFQLRPTGVD
jgi:hypothetical protein